MIRHYLKLIWNRKRSNLLIMVEIFLSFLVVFGVMTIGLRYADTYRRPLGFSREDVWAVSINLRSLNMEGAATTMPPEVLETYRQVIGAARELPEVLSVAGVTSTPYGHSHWTSGSDFGPWNLRYGVARTTDAFAKVLGLELTRGRWFDSRDDGASWVPVVINQRLATEIFGAKDAVGNAIPQEKNLDGTLSTELRVVGVVREYRQDGEIPGAHTPDNYLFQRHNLDDATRRPPDNLVLKVRRGTTAVFEEKLVRRLQAAAPDWSFEVQTLDQMRDDWMQESLAPLLAAGVIAGFLILMVGMGLTGVLWQTVTQRTREVGLRRAKGATIGDIRVQILGELVVMTSIAVLAGTALAVQFPLLKLVDFVPAGVYSASLVISAACIYLLTVACAWYPSRLATGIQPAEALHYE
jgi:putative ABC transport system permease protein